MKTIFITSFHPLISRNILRTGLLDILAGRDMKVVILAPQIKKEYFLKEFSGKNISVEGVDMVLSKRDFFFRQIALAITPTSDLYIKKRTKLYEDKKRFSFAAAMLPAFLFGRSKMALFVLRFFDYVFGDRKSIRDLFMKYKPDIIFSTDIQNEIDIRILQFAKKEKIKTAGMVRSWDNLTSKGVIRFCPDILITHNEVVKKEAVYYSRIDPGRIKVIGIPHYDKYLLGHAESRESFFKKFGFDINKKLILFAPIGDRYIKNNTTDQYVLDALSELDTNILVRIPPTDGVSFGGFESKKAKVAFDDAGTSSWKGGKKLNEIGASDDKSLISSLCHSNAVVTGQSTITIDAAVFGKPAVIIHFESPKHPYWESITKYYDYEYYAKFNEYCGLRFAESPADLVGLVNAYLENPEKDRDIRERILKNQVRFMDGRSTERLANILAKELSI